jgi:hypothetical protein
MKKGLLQLQPLDARVCTCSFILNTILLYSLLASNVRRPKICAAGEAVED